MKLSALTPTVVVVSLLMASAHSQDSVNLSSKQPAEEFAKRIKELQKERIATLKEMVDSITSLGTRGLASPEEVREARLQLLDAELDAAENESDRVKVYEKIVGVLKEYEHLAAEMAKATNGSPTAVLRIKARRLEAEIHLEQAKAQLAAESK